MIKVPHNSESLHIKHGLVTQSPPFLLTYRLVSDDDNNIHVCWMVLESGLGNLHGHLIK